MVSYLDGTGREGDSVLYLWRTGKRAAKAKETNWWRLAASPVRREERETFIYLGEEREEKLRSL